MSDTPRTDAFTENFWRVAHLRSAPVVFADFARELERDLAQRTAERDALAAELAALKANDPLAEMWAALEEYQPFADRDGHGESWARMCSERTEEAASAASWAASESAEAASAARAAAELAESAASESVESAASESAASWASAQSIAAIRKAKEAKP
jgi:hypothetical protein